MLNLRNLMHVISYKTVVSNLHIFYDFSCDKRVDIEVFSTTKRIFCYGEHGLEFQIKDEKQEKYFLKFCPAKGIEHKNDYSDEMISENILKVKASIRREKIREIIKSF